MKKQIYTSINFLIVLTLVLFSNTSNAQQIDKNNFYVLLIANETFNDSNMLANPNAIALADTLEKALIKYCSFKKENSIKLYNANKQVIMNQFDTLAQKLSKNDNLLIYFNGTGQYDNKQNKSYWFTKNSQLKTKENCIHASELDKKIDSLNVRHLLIITETVFPSQKIKPYTQAKSLDYEYLSNKQKYQIKSLSVITAGAVHQKPSNGLLMSYISKQLKQNKQKYFSSEQLFASIRESLLNNSSELPQFKKFRIDGLDTGDFIFIKRE